MKTHMENNGLDVTIPESNKWYSIWLQYDCLLVYLLQLDSNGLDVSFLLNSNIIRQFMIKRYNSIRTYIHKEIGYHLYPWSAFIPLILENQVQLGFLDENSKEQFLAEAAAKKHERNLEACVTNPNTFRERIQTEQNATIKEYCLAFVEKLDTSEHNWLDPEIHILW